MMNTMTASSQKRIGVFGGTFDPIHNAHIDIARAAIDFANLDVVFFVVAARPPHKSGDTYASPEQRLAMVEAALADQSGLQPSSLEIERDGPSYTAETLRQLEDVNHGADFFLILGHDSLIELSGWKDPETILFFARLLAVSRPGERKAVPEGLKGKYDIIPFNETPVSSTEIRQRIADGLSVDRLVPASVLGIIDREGLYNVKVTGGTGG